MINILPYRQKKIVERIRFLRLLTATISAMIILVLAGGALLIPILVAINGQYTVASKQIVLLEKTGVVASPIDVAALQLRTKVLLDRLANTTEKSPTEYIDIVREQALAGITLSAFVKNEGAQSPTFRIDGVAQNRDTLKQFVTTLGKHEAVASVDSPVSNYVKNTNSVFTLTVVFK